MGETKVGICCIDNAGLMRYCTRLETDIIRNKILIHNQLTYVIIKSMKFHLVSRATNGGFAELEYDVGIAIVDLSRQPVDICKI